MIAELPGALPTAAADSTAATASSQIAALPERQAAPATPPAHLPKTDTRLTETTLLTPTVLTYRIFLMTEGVRSDAEVVAAWTKSLRPSRHRSCEVVHFNCSNNHYALVVLDILDRFLVRGTSPQVRTPR